MKVNRYVLGTGLVSAYTYVVLCEMYFEGPKEFREAFVRPMTELWAKSQNGQPILGGDERTAGSFVPGDDEPTSGPAGQSAYVRKVGSPIFGHDVRSADTSFPDDERTTESTISRKT